MEALQHWEKILADRGILGAAKSFDWHPDGAGWQYPIYGNDGQHLIIGEPVWRWKAFDSSASPKYRWQPSGLGDNKPKYYLLPGTLFEIKATGRCIIASGEPDVLAYRSAGAKGVLCWFGEKAMPATLAADLRSFGVRWVEIAPDRDDTGLAWAQHIVNALDGSSIHTRIYELPAPLGSKFDINRLWINCKFDPDCFWDTFATCNELDIKPTELKVENLPLVSNTDKDWRDKYFRAIETALGVVKYKKNGFSEPVRCPYHDDSEPSAGWHETKHVLHCFVCMDEDESRSADETAQRIGVRIDDFRPAPPPTVKTVPVAPKPAPAGKPKLLYSWEEGTERFLQRLDGDVPAHDPLVMPFVHIRNLGGFAKRTKPGKVIAIVGDSGMGKTSWIETYVDAQRRAGFNGILWGPEWSFDDYVQRAVQRNGGPSYEAMEDHMAWLSEEKRRLPADKRTGVEMPTAQLKLARDKAEWMKGWPGKLSFVEKMALPIEAIVKNMQDEVNQFRSAGRRIAFAVLDYAQLVGAKSDTDIARLNHTLDIFKGFIVDNQLVGIIGSQMTKSDGRLAATGVKGSLHAMVNARSDIFNLALVLTRPVDENGVVSQVANCRIVKNSLGRTGDVPLYLNPDKMSWHDAEVKRIDLNPITSKEPYAAFGGHDYEE